MEDSRIKAPFPVVFDVWTEKLDSQQQSAMRDATAVRPGDDGSPLDDNDNDNDVAAVSHLSSSRGVVSSAMSALSSTFGSLSTSHTTSTSTSTLSPLPPLPPFAHAASAASVTSSPRVTFDVDARGRRRSLDGGPGLGDVSGGDDGAHSGWLPRRRGSMNSGGSGGGLLSPSAGAAAAAVAGGPSQRSVSTGGVPLGLSSAALHAAAVAAHDATLVVSPALESAVCSDDSANDATYLLMEGADVDPESLDGVGSAFGTGVAVAYVTGHGDSDDGDTMDGVGVPSRGGVAGVAPVAEGGRRVAGPVSLRRWESKGRRVAAVDRGGGRAGSASGGLLDAATSHGQASGPAPSTLPDSGHVPAGDGGRPAPILLIFMQVRRSLVLRCVWMLFVHGVCFFASFTSFGTGTLDGTVVVLVVVFVVAVVFAVVVGVVSFPPR